MSNHKNLTEQLAAISQHDDANPGANELARSGPVAKTIMGVCEEYVRMIENLEKRVEALEVRLNEFKLA